MTTNSELLIPAADHSLNQYATGMERLLIVLQGLSMARNLETITRIVRQAARNLTGADGATFVLRENGFCFYADEDAIEPLWKGKRFPMEICVSGWVMLNKKSVLIEDIYNDPRIPADAYRPTFVKSLAMVPIRSLNPIGAIGTYWASHRKPAVHELKLLQALADSTSVAMENVQLYSGLEQKVAERTARLQLLNEELDSFSQTVSHDLRAPLRHVSGFVELLKSEESNFSPKGEEYLKIISDSVINMNQLINDLLEFSRNARTELCQGTVDMNELVKQVWEDLKPEIKDRKISWKMASLPKVKADSSMLKQVWFNLLSNAIKYSRNRDVAEIEVGMNSGEKEIEFFVKDNGVGFDMKYASKLFGVFQRLHDARDFEGHGVGLAHVKRIISRHSGKVWAISENGCGSTFFFTLPSPIFPAAA